ncbi:hypothetical protein [uncultured Campylobacter sp.]|nr:hypothetical protein [uncultured Campylobacter sp.]
MKINLLIVLTIFIAGCSAIQPPKQSVVMEYEVTISSFAKESSFYRV